MANKSTKLDPMFTDPKMFAGGTAPDYDPEGNPSAGLTASRDRPMAFKPLSADDSERFEIGQEALKRGVPVEQVLEERGGILRQPKTREHSAIYVTDPDTGKTTVATPEQAGIEKHSLNRTSAELLQADREKRRERILTRMGEVERKLAKAKTIESKMRLGNTLKKLQAGLDETEQTDKEREGAAVAREDARYLRREEVRRELARRSIERRIKRGADPRIIDRHNEGAAGRGVDRFIAPEEVGLSRRVPESGEIIDAKDGPRRGQANAEGDMVEVPVQESGDGGFVLDASTMTPAEFGQYYTASDARSFRSEVYRGGGAFADRQRRIDSGRMALLDDDLDEDAKAEGQAALDEREAALHYEFSKRVGSKRPVVDSSKSKGGDAGPESITDADVIDFINEQRVKDGEDPIASFAEVPASVRDAAAAAIARRRRQEEEPYDPTIHSNAPSQDELQPDTDAASFDQEFYSGFFKLTNKRFVSVNEVTEYIRNNPDEERAAVDVAKTISGNDIALRKSILDRFLP